jgi:hypothetical protein
MPKFLTVIKAIYVDVTLLPLRPLSPLSPGGLVDGHFMETLAEFDNYARVENTQIKNKTP